MWFEDLQFSILCYWSEMLIYAPFGVYFEGKNLGK